MLKKAFLLFLLLILVPLSYGLNINSNSNSYGYKETVIGNIDLTGAYNPNINFQNIILLDQNNNKKNLALTLTKINNLNYLYYFDFPSNSQYGNYTLYLNNIEVLDNGLLFRTNASTIIEYNQDNYSLSINPALIYTNDLVNNNFLILVIKNNINPTNITITKPSFVRLNSDYISLKSNSTFILQILLDKNYNYNEGLNDYLKIFYSDKSLVLPIYIYNTNVSINIPNNIKKLVSINEKSSINKTLDINDTLNGPFLFKNIGNVTIQKVFLSIPDNLKDVLQVQQQEFDNVPVDKEIDFNITLNPTKIQNIGTYEGSININYDDNLLYFPFRLELTSSDENITVAQNLTYTNSSNNLNNTNITKIQEIKNPGFSLVWIIVIFVAILAIILLVFLFKKPKNKKDPENFDQIISNYMKK